MRALALLRLGLFAGSVAGGLAGAARAEEPMDAAPPEAGEAAGASADRWEGGAAGAPAPPYGASDLDRHRGESVDLDARAATTSAPDFDDETKDPGSLSGSTKPLDAVSRPAGGRDPEAREDATPRERADDAAEGAQPRDPAPPPGPAPLRLRRRPDVAAAAERTLSERLCAAERDVRFARREHEEATRAYKRARRDEYPRGAHRALVVEHRALSARRLERAEAERDALHAEADTQQLDPAASPCRRPL